MKGKWLLAAGAVGSPELLLRSGYDPSGRVGRRTFLHPVVASVGFFPRPVEAFYGAPQASYTAGVPLLTDYFGPSTSGLGLRSGPSTQLVGLSALSATVTASPLQPDPVSAVPEPSSAAASQRLPGRSWESSRSSIVMTRPDFRRAVPRKSTPPRGAAQRRSRERGGGHPASIARLNAAPTRAGPGKYAHSCACG